MSGEAISEARKNRIYELQTALSACQEELARCKVHAERADEARHAADHGRASEFKRAHAAETARDEAVKREKALMESEDELATELAEERVLTQALVEALREIAEAMPDEPDLSHGDGGYDAGHIARAALDQSGKP